MSNPANSDDTEKTAPEVDITFDKDVWSNCPPYYNQPY